MEVSNLRIVGQNRRLKMKIYYFSFYEEKKTVTMIAGLELNHNFHRLGLGRGAGFTLSVSSPPPFRWRPIAKTS